MLQKHRKLTLWETLIMAKGKLRRQWLTHFRKDYVERNKARRRGSCSRCGICCNFVFTCPWVDYSTKPSSCTCHETKWLVCQTFPIDERDLRDRYILDPERPCSYHFVTWDELEAEQKRGQAPKQKHEQKMKPQAVRR